MAKHIIAHIEETTKGTKMGRSFKMQVLLTAVPQCNTAHTVQQTTASSFSQCCPDVRCSAGSSGFAVSEKVIRGVELTEK